MKLGLLKIVVAMFVVVYSTIANAASCGKELSECGILPACPARTQAFTGIVAGTVDWPNKPEPVDIPQCCDTPEKPAWQWAQDLSIAASGGSDVDKALYRHWEIDEECECQAVENDEWNVTSE